jgi:hypothetical protein
MKLVLALSLALNVALAMAAVNSWEKRSALPQRRLAPPQIPHQHENRPAAPAFQLDPVTNRFDWRIIESSDYEEYVANLRAIGCPEKTVRDIIVAEVQKAYAVKSAALPLDAKFWSCGLERQAAERAREERQSELKAESGALLQRLIGTDYVTQVGEHSDDLEMQAILRFTFGPLPDDVMERVSLAMEKGSSLGREIQDRSKGILLPVEKEQLSKLRQQIFASVQQLLSAEQFAELTRRFATISLLDQGFSDFHVNADELRYIAGLYVSVFGAPLEEAFNFPHDDEEESRGARKELFEKKLQDFLGQARYAEYKRDTDSDFKNIQALTEQQTLPRETALKIYEIKTLFDSECRRLREVALLPASELAAHLQEVQDSTRTAVQELLGDKSFDLYVRQHGGGWVTNSLRP